MISTFRALEVPNYRKWAIGGVIGNAGTWMQRVAQDWLVLTELTNHSAVAVGITTGLQFAPMLVLAPYAGILADRLPKRLLVMWAQSAMGIFALILGLLIVTDTAQLWMVYLLATLSGVAGAVDSPARQAFVSEVVGPRHLSNAVSLNSASFHAGRLIGPGIAGLLIAWVGTGPVFLINAASFVAVLIALGSMNTAELNPTPPVVRQSGQFIEGLKYVRGHPDILIVLGLVFVIGTFGMNFQMTTALMVTSVYGGTAQQYGILGSIMAIGSLTGALLTARRPQPSLRFVISTTFAFGVAASAASLMPTYLSFAALLILVGLAAIMTMTAANTFIQLSSDPEVRGRVMSLYIAIFLGGTPLGSPIIGWVGEAWGARWTILLGGLLSLIAAVAAGWIQLRRRDLRVSFRLQGRPRVIVHEREYRADESGPNNSRE